MAGQAIRERRRNKANNRQSGLGQGAEYEAEDKPGDEQWADRDDSGQNVALQAGAAGVQGQVSRDSPKNENTSSRDGPERADSGLADQALGRLIWARWDPILHRQSEAMVAQTKVEPEKRSRMRK